MVFDSIDGTMRFVMDDGWESQAKSRIFLVPITYAFENSNSMINPHCPIRSTISPADEN